MIEFEILQEDYFVFSNAKIANNEYDNATLFVLPHKCKNGIYTPYPKSE